MCVRDKCLGLMSDTLIQGNFRRCIFVAGVQDNVVLNPMIHALNSAHAVTLSGYHVTCKVCKRGWSIMSAVVHTSLPYGRQA